MDIPTALDQLRHTESARNEGILAPATTLALAVSRLGGGPENNELIVAGTLSELAQLGPESFGQPLHSLVIVGPRVHPLEIEYAAQFAVNPDSWRDVARTAYKCPL
jgi:diphthine synthase